MKKIWLHSYPEGIPETISLDQYRSLIEAFDDFFKRYQNRTAFSNFGSRLSYHQLDQYSRDFAAYLQSTLGFKMGDHVAIMMPNVLQYPVALLGILRAGLVVVNINPLFTSRELKIVLEDSAAKGIVVLENYAHLVENVMPAVPIKHVIVTKIGDLLPGLKGFLFNVVVKYIKKKVPDWQINEVHAFKKALKKGRSLNVFPPAINGEDLAFLQYTGGTTGMPKGAMLSHQNLLANIFQCHAWLGNHLGNNPESFLVPLPLYHIFSLTLSCFTFLALGYHCILITDPRDINGLVKCWRKENPSGFVTLNTLMQRLLKNSSFKSINFKSLKLTVSGGMKTHPVVAEKWEKLTGNIVIEGYGLTESSPVLTVNPLNSSYFKGSVGLPLPNTEIKICDENGVSLNVNEAGELWARGPQVMAGYWQNPKETELVLTGEGWLKTGDIMRMDEEGFLYYLDRKKEMINVSGFNVYPSEVEAVIARHAGVSEVAITGAKNRLGEEVVKAWIIKKDPQLTKQSVLEHCYHELTHYKVPKKIEFTESLPKSPVGKILRYQLK